MRLLNVRKGQFVYFENKLHKVYSVNPFLKQPIHLIRLHDFEQKLASPKDLELYKPQHLDSFVVIDKRYTLDKDVTAKVGDYILVINPKPDSFDNHHLHAIEVVSSIEKNGVISNKSNGIKHHEYWVMVPGLSDGATTIDLQDPDGGTDGEAVEPIVGDTPETYVPKIGDVYQRNDSKPLVQAMVVAVKGKNVYLGSDIVVRVEALTDTDRWSYLLNVMDT